MKSTNKLYLFLILFLTFFGQVFGQNFFIVEPSDPSDITTFLNSVIDADTTDTGERAHEVYVLRRDGIYLMNNWITLTNSPLTIQAEDGDGDKPTIYGWLNEAGERYPLTLFAVGNTLTVKNLKIVQWFEQQPETIALMRYEIFWMNVEGSSLIIDSCVISGSQQMILQVPKAANTIKITNSTLAQAGNLYAVNQGNGRHIDLRDSAVDTLIVQNCTLTDNIDRVIRHRGSPAPLKYLLFDHNTVVNSWGYHGCIELGSVGDYIQITNNVFIDPMAAGTDSTDDIRLGEFEASGELDEFGNNRMTLISCVPNDTTQFNIDYNYYSITDDMKSFYDLHSDIGLGEFTPLTWFLNKKVADSTTAFQLDDITMVAKTHSLKSMTEWYWDCDNGPCKNKELTGFSEEFDMERPLIDFYTDKSSFDLSYNQSAKAFTGDENGYPAGDLHWWEGIVGVEKISDVIPAKIALSQNYPNPFNPSTIITYSIPQNSKVSLEVFNVLGQKVATLITQTQKAGEYEINFDGSELTSGLYIYRLSTNSATISKKMLLLK